LLAGGALAAGMSGVRSYLTPPVDVVPAPRVRPYVLPLPPASQTSPSWPATALTLTVPDAGSPVAAVAVNDTPPLVLT